MKRRVMKKLEFRPVTSTERDQIELDVRKKFATKAGIALLIVTLAVIAGILFFTWKSNPAVGIIVSLIFAVLMTVIYLSMRIQMRKMLKCIDREEIACADCRIVDLFRVRARREHVKYCYHVEAQGEKFVVEDKDFIHYRFSKACGPAMIVRFGKKLYKIRDVALDEDAASEKAETTEAAIAETEAGQQAFPVQEDVGREISAQQETGDVTETETENKVGDEAEQNEQ